MSLFRHVVFGLAAFIAILITGPRAVVADLSTPSHVELRQIDGGWQLFCDGQPFFIQGAGGDASREMIKQGKAASDLRMKKKTNER